MGLLEQGSQRSKQELGFLTRPKRRRASNKARRRKEKREEGRRATTWPGWRGIRKEEGGMSVAARQHGGAGGWVRRNAKATEVSECVTSLFWEEVTTARRRRRWRRAMDSGSGEGGWAVVALHWRCARGDGKATDCGKERENKGFWVESRRKWKRRFWEQ